MDGERSFGERFLEEYEALGGSFAAWDWATIQELRRADREAFVRVLKKRASLLSYAQIQRIRRLEPEELARDLLATQRAQGASAGSAMMWAFLLT